ncbi:MAG: shikimate kinase [Nocardioidaceae bacterium]|nr:shikimate kinase [Nocardioidaceae bacterium]
MSAPICGLIGAMGSGKTTVGELAAARLGVDLLDTDHVVEQRAHKSVPDIFIEDGEAAFRELERNAVAWALENHEGVLSLGGGAVLDPATQVLLAAHHVVFLRVGLSEAVKRVGLGVGRPLLLGNVRSRVKKILDERASVYQGLARVTVDTDERSPDEVADDVLAAIASVEEDS